MLIGTCLAVFRALVFPDPAAERAHAALATAQLRLTRTPAVTVTGHIGDTPQDSITLDLVVSNVGDATGSVISASGTRLSYTAIAGVTLLEGTDEQWAGFGVAPDAVASFDGDPVVVPNGFFGIDLAKAITPINLAVELGPAAEQPAPVRIGTPIELRGHRATPVTSGEFTTYLSGFDPDSRQPSTPPASPAPRDHSPDTDDTPPTSTAHSPLDEPRVDRVVYSPADPSEPDAQLDFQELGADETGELYDRLRESQDRLRRAIDPQIQISGTAKGRFRENPCTGLCHVDFTVGSSVEAAHDALRSVTLDYRVSFQFPATIVSGCSGTEVLPPNTSVDRTCIITYSPATAGNLLEGDVLVRPRAFESAAIKEIIHRITTGADLSGSLSPDKPDSASMALDRHRHSGADNESDRWKKRYDAVRAVEAKSKNTSPSTQETAKPPVRELTKQELDSIQSYRNLIDDHRAKLEAYKADPWAYDNKGILRDAPNDEVRQSIINGRIDHLEKEIRTFERNIDKILEAAGHK